MKHEIDTYGIVGNGQIYCVECNKVFDRDIHEKAYIYEDEAGDDLKGGYVCHECSNIWNDDGENVVEIAIKKAMEYEKNIGGDLSDLDNPYEIISQYINISDIWPKDDDETSHQWAERVEFEIDSVWSRMKYRQARPVRYPDDSGHSRLL